MKHTSTDRLKLISIAYHRNGVSGMPAYVALVDEWEDGAKRRMVVTRVQDADRGTGMVNCFALDVGLLAKGDVRFGSNSWRGDHYHEFMDKEINRYEKERKDTWALL